MKPSEVRLAKPEAKNRAAFAAAMMNVVAPSNAELAARVFRVFQLLLYVTRQYRIYLEGAEGNQTLAEMLRLGGTLRSAEKARAELNGILRKYAVTPQVEAPTQPGESVLSWRPMDSSRALEGTLIANLYQLAITGDIAKLKICVECGRWFATGYLARGMYCGKKCQQRHFQENPEYKKRRNSERRKQYREGRERERRLLEMVKRAK